MTGQLGRLWDAASGLTEEGFIAAFAQLMECADVDSLATILGLCGQTQGADRLIAMHLDSCEFGGCEHHELGLPVSPTIEEYVNDLMDGSTLPIRH